MHFLGKNWKSQEIGSDNGLHWKSLTQPAILPINTDYIPSVNELKKNYDVINSYQLFLDRLDSPF